MPSGPPPSPPRLPQSFTLAELRSMSDARLREVVERWHEAADAAARLAAAVRAIAEQPERELADRRRTRDGTAATKRRR